MASLTCRYQTSRQAARWRTAVGQVRHFLFSPFPPPPPSFARADLKPFQPQAKMQKPPIAFPIPPRVIGRAATACTRAARVPCGMHGESGARCAHFCPKPPLKPPSKPPSLPRSQQPWHLRCGPVTLATGWQSPCSALGWFATRVRSCIDLSVSLPAGYKGPDAA